MSDTKQTLRIMSYNILAERYGEITASSRADIVNDVIISYSPDVVGIQEVDAAWHTELDKVIKDGNYKFACKNIPSGKPCLTTFLYNINTVKLKSECFIDIEPDNDIRVFAVAVFERLSDGKLFLVTNTHPVPASRGQVYLDHMEKIAAFTNQRLEKYKKLPLIMTGDFNTRESSEHYEKFISDTGLFDAKIKTKVLVKDVSSFGRFGLPHQENFTSLDHIFINDRVEVKLFDTVTDKGVENASDHIPIYADINI